MNKLKIHGKVCEKIIEVESIKRYNEASLKGSYFGEESYTGKLSQFE